MDPTLVRPDGGACGSVTRQTCTAKTKWTGTIARIATVSLALFAVSSITPVLGYPKPAGNSHVAKLGERISIDINSAGSARNGSAGPQPNSTGPPITELADGFSHNMGSGSASRPFGEVRNWVWYRSADGSLSRKEISARSQSPWSTYNGTRFLTAPVLSQVSQGRDETFAFALEASTGALLYTFHTAGAWDASSAWRSLGGRFAYPPTALTWNRWTEVYAMTDEGQLWRRQFNSFWGTGPRWGDWDLLGAGFAGMPAINQDNERIGVKHMAAVKDDTYQVLPVGRIGNSPSWPRAWHDLGRPPACVDAPLGSPRMVTMKEEYDEYIVACQGKLWHRVSRGAWADSWDPLEADGGENLAHDNHGQTIFHDQYGSFYLVSWTSGACYYSSWLERYYDPPDYVENYRWGSWRRLWCPDESQQELATTMACDQYLLRCDIYREDLEGRVLHSFEYPSRENELTWVSLEGRVKQ